MIEREHLLYNAFEMAFVPTVLFWKMFYSNADIATWTPAISNSLWNSLYCTFPDLQGSL